MITESVPQHAYTRYANSVHHWMPMDDHERWRRNCEDAAQRQLLLHYGWLPEREFTYVFNSHGFRSPEFNDSPAVLCLGCSHTMGIGLPEDETWPSILQKRMDLTCWNLGLGGAALDTLFRLADFYVRNLNIVAVLCLVPEIKRFEFFRYGQPEVCNWSNIEHEIDFLKIWLADDQNSKINRQKNLLSMQRICDVAGVPFVPFVDFTDQILSKSRARDLMHYGYQDQITIAEHFYSSISLVNGHK